MTAGRWRVLAPSALLLVAAFGAVATRPPDLGPGTLRDSTLTPTRIPGPCERGARRPFAPTSMDIQHVRTGLQVVGLPRDGADVPGVPPVSATYTVAWDAPGPKPGGSSGLVRFNAHTWPNGAALGNAMLAAVHVGDRLTLRSGTTFLCYRVTKRVEVSGYQTYDPFFALDGPPQLAFIVCSGQRVGPGNWTKRTLWFGEPYYR